MGRTVDNIVPEKMWRLHKYYLKQKIRIVTELKYLAKYSVIFY